MTWSQARIQGLVAYDLDRVVRDPRDLEDLIDVAESTHHPVRSVTGSLQLDTDADITNARVLVAMANKSSRDTARRVARAARERAERGQWHGGTPTFGLSAVKEVTNGRERVVDLVPHPVHVEWVREGIRRLLAGETLYGVCLDWNAKGRRTEWTRWQRTQAGGFAHDSNGKRITYVGLESEAAELRVYEPITVHGLLQTEEYARALLNTSAQAPEPAVSVDTIESKVRVRMERQAALSRLRLWVVLDEAVIRRVIGSADVMRDQYARLLEMARLPSVKLQVLPFRDTANPAPPTNFTIIEFEQASDEDVVYVELLTGGIYVEGADVRRYNVAFNNRRAAALSPARSTTLIEEVAAGST